MMKKLIVLFMALGLINLNTMAQKGFELTKEIVINVPAEQLWEMVGPGFETVYLWSSNVDHAVGSGTSEFEGAPFSTRACDVNVKGFSKIHETLIKYDDDSMNLAYQVNEGMPGFVTKAVNDWTVVSLGDNQCKLVMQAEFGSKGLMGAMMNGMMKKKMATTLETVLNDAKVYAETGAISAAKQDRINELEKKKKAA